MMKLLQSSDLKVENFCILNIYGSYYNLIHLIIISHMHRSKNKMKEKEEERERMHQILNKEVKH